MYALRLEFLQQDLVDEGVVLLRLDLRLEVLCRGTSCDVPLLFLSWPILFSLETLRPRAYFGTTRPLFLPRPNPTVRTLWSPT